MGGLAGDPTGEALAHGKAWRVPLLAGGELGAWEPLAGLPETRTVHGIAVVAGHVVVSGGVTGVRESDAVLAAPIGADGLGAWSALDPLPFARAHTHHTPLVGDKLYSVGGFLRSGESTSAVLVGTVR